LWGRGGAVDAGDALVHHDLVCHVGGHDEVVLNDERRLSRVENESLDDASSNKTLLSVKITAANASIQRTKGPQQDGDAQR
jgi:hypothetical protein